MERVPEPELMNEDEQAEAYALADFDEPNQAFVDRFLALASDFESGRIVDLGCGPADIAIRLCRALPGVEVVAVDGSRAMIAQARAAVQAQALGERIHLVEARVPRALPAGMRFDAVLSNSLLHHLPEPSVLWREIGLLAAPGAHVLVADLFRPDSEERAREIVERYSGDEPEVLRRDFYCSLLAAFTPDEVREQLAAAGLGESLEVEVISDRHLAVHGRAP